MNTIIFGKRTRLESDELLASICASEPLEVVEIATLTPTAVEQLGFVILPSRIVRLIDGVV